MIKRVTAITPDNISYVKKLMEVSEVRHLAGVKCNFGIVDRKAACFIQFHTKTNHCS